MAEPKTALIDLDDTDLTLEDPREDIRGVKVYDRDGEDVGAVDGLLVDEQEHKVRFIKVGSGGFLGIGKSERLVPVDAITRIEEEGVHLDKHRSAVADSPAYDPEVVQAPTYYDGLYGYYGYAPYWTPGYMYPFRPYPYT